MEVADNQHPIDLSPKCRYYDDSRGPCMKSAISSSRPLPDLIPIRILQDGSSPPAHNSRPFSSYSPSPSSSPFSTNSSFSSKRDRQLFECFKSCNQSLMGLQVKDGWRDRKESSRYKGGSPLGSSSMMSSPSTSPFSSSSSSSMSPFSNSSSSYGSKMRKSQSDTRIAMPSCLGPTEYTFGGRSSVASNHLNVVPMDRNNVITRSDGIGKYAAQRDKFNSSCFSESKRERRSDEDEISSSVFPSNSNKYVRQGPGVSVSTIQSLRKLLDKRKSMQK